MWQSGSSRVSFRVGTPLTGEMEELGVTDMGSIDGNGEINGRAKAEDQGAVALVLDLAKAFERVSFLEVWAWATHFSFT